MEFKPSQIIDTQGDWHALISEVKKLEEDGSKQLIYRAMEKWPEYEDANKSSCANKSTQDVENAEKPTAISITSSFDDAWERASPGMRNNRKDEHRRLYESWMLMDFKREAHHYFTDLPERGDFLDWMALARHYGMPSRLVDCTYSFYVAAYFALSKRGRHPDKDGTWPEKNDEDGCVLAVNLDWLKGFAENLMGDSFHVPAVFHRFAFELNIKCVVPVNPLRRNARLARQQGLFLCPSSIEYPFEKNLQAMIDGQADDKLIRLIRLPAKIRSEALRELDRMNIGLHTLYGDLTGWAESRRDLVHKPLPGGDDRFIKELERAIGPNPLI